MEVREPYKIIATGSSGNCVMIFDKILVDVGVSFSAIKDVYKQIKLITWSHSHTDHFNNKTISKLISLRPTLRVAVCEHEHQRALDCGAKNIDILEHGKWYDYGEFKIATFKTYHDVPSNGWRFKNNNYKIFFATDTKTLEGVTARGYDLYCIEANYSEPIAQQMIEQAREKGEFTHIIGSINSHLSEEQCNDFFYKNKNEHSKLIRLHETRSYL